MIAPRGRSSGFTLLELLVVLVIMGLFAGLVSALVRPDERTLLRTEAERLAQLLELASTEASISGKAIAWTADAGDYRFWQYRSNVGWQEIGGNSLLHPRTLPEGMVIEALTIDTVPIQGRMRLEFGYYGSTPSYAIRMGMGAERYWVTGSPVGDMKAAPG